LAVLRRNHPLQLNRRKSSLQASRAEAAGYEEKTRAAKKKPHPKTKLGLPDLDQAKAAVLGGLHSPQFQRGYQHSINEFINWYCSEPRCPSTRPSSPGTELACGWAFQEDHIKQEATFNWPLWLW
jgi:hypothetical protein